MTGYLGSYATLGLLLLAAVLFFVTAFSANRVLRPARPADPAGKRAGYECGLETYSFENDIYNLHFSTADKKGDWITNTCEAPIVEEIDTIEEEEDTTEESEVTTLNNAVDWF